jgi:hypothetical protein
MAVAATLSLAGLPLACHAQPATPAPAADDLDSLTSQEIQQDIGTFHVLWGMQLTAKQAADLVGIFTPAADLAATVRKASDSPEGRAALLAVRAAAAVGKPPTQEMVARLDAARRAATGAAGPPPPGKGGQGGQNPEQRMWQTAQEAARDALALLTPDQVLSAAAPQIGDQAHSLLQQIAQIKQTNPAMWQPWKQAITQAMAENLKDSPDLATQLGPALDEAWGMPPQASPAQRAQVQGKLFKALAPKMNDADRTQRASGYFAGSLVSNPRFMVCLKEYLQNVTAAAQPAPAPGP